MYALLAICILYLIVAAFYYGFGCGLRAELDRFGERWDAGQLIGEAVVAECKLLYPQDKQPS